jgi:hypothetical protein
MGRGGVFGVWLGFDCGTTLPPISLVEFGDVDVSVIAAAWAAT